MNVVPKEGNKPPVSEKLFYRIGEVSKITGLEPYVLRYWETEFPFLRPRKSSSGHRVYTKREIELIVNIKKLLYEEKYTIEGVRKKFGIIKNNISEVGKETQFKERLNKIKSRLQRLIELLK